MIENLRLGGHTNSQDLPENIDRVLDLFPVLKDRLLQYHSEEHILNNMLYGVEYMEDNHKELCNRLGISTTHPHYVCADALNYHYKFDGTPLEATLDGFF